MDYKQKYETAIKQAKEELKACGDLDCDAARQIFRLFPELKESEDEKVRRVLREIVLQWKNGHQAWCSDDKEIDTILAWLEKHGEQNKIQLGKMYKCIASPRYSTFMTGLIYVPQDKFLCSLMNFCSDCFEPIEDGEQKPAEKVDSNLLTVERAKEMSPFMRNGFENEPTAWSEEDETILANLIYALANDRIGNNRDEYVDWLKSLKDRVQLQPQSQWKPSDNQIKALKWVLQNIPYNIHKEEISGLLDQIKEL